MPALSEREKEEITEFIFYHKTRIHPPPGTPSLSATWLGAGTFGATYKVGSYAVKVLELKDQQAEAYFIEEVKNWEKLSKLKKLELYIPNYEGFSFFKYVPQKEYQDSVKDLSGIALFTQPGIRVIGCIFQEYEPVDPLDQVITNMKILKRVGSSSKVKISQTARLLRNETTAAMFLDNLILAYRYLHEAGFVHRDIKPGNILVRRGEDTVHLPIVIDIGMLCEIPCIDTITKGTYKYMPRNYLNKLNRVNSGYFNVNTRSSSTLSTKIKDGLRRIFRLRLNKPIRPTRKIAFMKQYEPYTPFYNKHTDNYALAITIQAFIKNVDWKSTESKEKYEDIALRYIYAMAIFLTAGKNALKNLTRNRKNVNALARLVFMNEHASPASREALPPLPNSNSENNND